MAKVNDTDIYKFDFTPSLLDFLLGTDAYDNKKTKNYRIKDIIQLINGVNGKNNLQFIYSDGSNPDISQYTTGCFFTDTLDGNPLNFTQLILNKSSLQPIDLTLLFQRLNELQDVVIKLDNPVDPNNFLNFKIVSIDDQTDFFVFEVVIFKDFYSGELLNETIYSVYFDIKSGSESDPLKLDRGGYAGNATNLDNRITDLENTTFPDAVLKTGEITIVGNEASIVIGAFNWRLNQVEFLNPPLYSVTIIEATDGFYRTDILVGDNTGNYHLIQGTEDEVVAPEPSVPDGMIKLSSIPVFGATIGSSVPSTIGDNYVKKTEFSNVLLTGSGVINQLNLIDEKATVVFKGAITELKTISYDSIPYNGKRITLFNAQNTAVTIANSVNGFGVSFMFPNNQDYVLKPKQTIEFSFDITYFPYAHHRYIGEIRDQISDIENLSTELGDRYTKSEADTLLDAKLDASVYNQHFKGVYVTLAALNTAYPTASVGDYAQVNEVGATDVVNYNWDDEDSLWVAGGGTGGAANTDALPEGSTNLYWTVARFFANLTYANVIAALGFTPSTAPNDAQKNSDITKSEIEAKLTGEINSHTHQKTDTISYAISDTSTALVAGDTDPFNAPYNFTLVNYWIGVKTAPTVSSLIVDLKKNGTSITSTKAGIDATEKTSLTGTSPVLTTTSFTKGDEITPNIYQVGSSETGRSLKLYLEIIKT